MRGDEEVIDVIEGPENDFSEIPLLDRFVRDDVLIEGRNDDLYRTPVEGGDFVGYDQDGSMVLMKGAPEPTEQDYDAFSEAVDKVLDLELGVYLENDRSDDRDAVAFEDFRGAVEHLDPEYVVDEIDDPNGNYWGIDKF